MRDRGFTISVGMILQLRAKGQFTDLFARIKSLKSRSCLLGAGRPAQQITLGIRQLGRRSQATGARLLRKDVSYLQHSGAECATSHSFSSFCDDHYSGFRTNRQCQTVYC